MAALDYHAEERSKAEFDVEEMKIVWAGSRHDYEINDRVARLVASDPVFRKDNRTMLTRKDLFKDTLRKAAHAWKRIIELRLSEDEAYKLRFYVDQPAFTDLHWGMFIPAIKGQGTEEQQEKWLPMAYKMQIIGCYAQTELGHGSNVQGLETTATFDPQTDEFVIHSPTLTSSKWWPGGLGKVSTHAVVYARLITDGKDHGVHGFIVQLRSLDDHSPLPGITVGDIGMKFGSGAYNSMDNGVLRFDHVRIPRNQMLMRDSQVTREGKYMHSDVPTQLVYGTMVNVRQKIVSNASGALSRAVCIATRYSAVRRQFGSQNGGPETQDGIEECRKLCGGHGYLSSSGLPELFAVYAPNCTYEGDNIVLLLQVARFLMKTFSQLGSGKKPVGTTAYMGRAEHLMQCCCEVERAEDWLKPSVILEAFEARAARMSVSCATNLSKFSNPEEGFAELSADLVEAAVAHCQLIVVSKFVEKLQQDIPGKGVKRQLEILCNVYALYLLHKHLGDFVTTGCITPKQGALANEQLRLLYSQVRPNAIALVDAFNYTDHYLGSDLGCYDGNVYQKLYEGAWKDPLNDTDVPDGYHEYIRPILKQHIRTARL
ncbi:peroxisomal acyl-coenzyme A oxidase 1-like isoform X3 [Durio zibethinus]|uniref:Acyl-coenzyme A oxidase n=1 Tax=Durio zibethinus TaxID=66656 RepID=A0A6P5WS06_DURZI|nr:peroxisomal acyl-coenzyme A oxidase 1-like isoform X3 [Durio zibethinus]